MTVKELKALLENCNDKDIVVMSRDSEGNGYSPLTELQEMKYRADSTWSGEVGYRELTDELIELGFSEEDIVEDGINAVVLWPVN